PATARTSTTVATMSSSTMAGASWAGSRSRTWSTNPAGSEEPPMPVPVGLNVWSRLVEELFPYLDRTVAPFESLWFPDHVQYGANKVAEGWTLLAFALAPYPDKLCTHYMLCN